ncbi:hypothetical protein J18TS1_30710 [Oceanobacillus oncorhynchi subsp. incaldanensis]|uniref:hypothetical protein n=1 Tax=Oceanobacillus oncorhynchi TaxID=545501 RepID=UPI0015845E13|nr:hypothetical protein [Oceanobacillus oncorhynchi]GIO19971.1 hypothetical protein J18TS1_30710 [Oceanobacillus oncorhynchi subsp. incaldanensis]
MIFEKFSNTYILDASFLSSPANFPVLNKKLPNIIRISPGTGAIRAEEKPVKNRSNP